MAALLIFERIQNLRATGSAASSSCAAREMRGRVPSFSNHIPPRKLAP